MASVMLRGIDGPRGIFTGDQVRAAIRSGRRHEPRSRLLSVENTSNSGGGSVWPIDRIHEVTGVAREHGLASHMDGARLMNAVIASGTSAADYCAPFDSVWLDFSKGLGAPVGAVLAGSAGFIDEAWRCKQQMGGAMRQAGIIAAACLYALDHHVERIAEDHDNAKLLAQGLAAIPGIELDPASIETNIVYFRLAASAPSTTEVARRLEAHGVRIGAAGSNLMRAVTHLDIDRAGIEVAIDAMGRVMVAG
jgi:threonine aldolase